LGLGIAAFAYLYARRHARNPEFSFGTGKVNSLGGFTGALLLVGFAVVMAWESIERAMNPVAIQFDWAIAVAA
ncbi:cation transporter, partial [Campylobacter jejuni]